MNFLDLICTLSIVGIYPRFIEPNLLQVTQHQLVTKFPSLDQFKILQLSDLHFGPDLNPRFLDKIITRSLELAPDLIVFTGDFIQYGQVADIEVLKDFLTAFHAPYGCFAVLGNHDYDQYVGINKDRSYGVRSPVNPSTQLKNRFTKIQKGPTGSFSISLKDIQPNPTLLSIFDQSSIKLLHNESVQIHPDLTIYGTGEYWAADCDERFPKTDNYRLLLIHNPDGYKFFKNQSIDLALSGHVHNGQINLPWIKKLFLLNEDGYQAGFYDKLYVNRGLGGTLPLRFRSVPEISLFKLNYEKLPS